MCLSNLGLKRFTEIASTTLDGSLFQVVAILLVTREKINVRLKLDGVFLDAKKRVFLSVN